MNRRTFMQALAAFLGMFGLGSLVAKEPAKFNVKKWAQWLHECDQYTMNTFTDITICDECGEGHAVPIIWADEDKAIKFVQRPISESVIGHTSNPEFEKLSSNQYMEALRDRTVKIEMPELRLPLINIIRHFHFAGPNVCIFYTVTARTLHQKDMDQILDQIVNKFNPTHEYECGTMELLYISSMLNIKNRDDPFIINKCQFNIKVTSLPA